MFYTFAHCESQIIRLQKSAYEFNSSHTFTKVEASHFQKSYDFILDFGSMRSIINSPIDIKWSEIVTLNVSHFY